MKPSKSKRRIYLRTFCALFAVYLMLMTGFTLLQLYQEKKASSQEFRTFALQMSNVIEGILKDHADDSNQVTDITGFKEDMLSKTAFFTDPKTEMAVYTENYSLLFHTSDNWIISYTSNTDGNIHPIGYAQLNPGQWLSEENVMELERYLRAKPKAKQPGDLSGYIVQLQGFWLDGIQVIPDKLNVLPMYAETFQENGKVSGSRSGTAEEALVYASGYANTRSLPYIQSGNIQFFEEHAANPSTQAALRNMVLDQQKLAETIMEHPVSISYERVSGLTFRYYVLQPYLNTLHTTEGNKTASEYWTAFSRQVNLWDRCYDTVMYVGIGCFLIFLTVAYMLSSQTYKTYQQREELDRYRRETANALAHDLKTPLSIISGYAQNLLENVQTAKREQYAASILANVNRMDKIIREMLELSRYDSISESVPIHFTEVSLRQVCAEIIDRYKQVCGEKSVTVHLEGNTVVNADFSLMTRVIDNFFINALDHVPDGGVIRITITDQTLECFNSGSHIPEGLLADIWQPFKKAEDSRGSTKGTGLGLTISRSILELHHFPHGARNSEDGVAFWFKHHS